MRGWREGEWELCSDEGFVYKRRRRHLSPSAPPPDPGAERRQRRARKKKALTKLTEKYDVEIRQWEALSADLKAINDPPPPPPPPPPPQPSPESSSSIQSLLGEFLSQAEAQEMFLQDMSNLCDVVENMCNTYEERYKQLFFDLPVWGTPHSLMASLSEVHDSGGNDHDKSHRDLPM